MTYSYKMLPFSLHTFKYKNIASNGWTIQFLQFLECTEGDDLSYSIIMVQMFNDWFLSKNHCINEKLIDIRSHMTDEHSINLNLFVTFLD